MDHFSIVLALARSALQNPNVAVRQHLERLQEALTSAGSSEEARALSKLLSGDERSGKIEPTRVILTRAVVAGEVMSPTVRPPADRETGNLLAQIVHPAQLNDRPLVFNASLQPAVDSLVEEWTHLEKFLALSVRPPLNCLLFGAPGTGKTQLARAIAKRLELPLVVARLDGLISSFLGTTARNIASLFDFANRYQCVLLLDEFDAIAKIRDDPHEVGEIKRVVNTLLQCLDSRSSIGFTLAITNHEQLLDSAIWRRFDVRVHVPKPDFASRQAIVERYTAGITLSDADRRLLAWFTEGRSGAEIETLCNAILRMFVLKKSDDFSMAEALRVNAQLSADFRESPRQQKLVGEFEALARTLVTDEDVRFTQGELAQIFNRDQSTISRWLKQDGVPRRR
ncbi:MAG TPA: ATP-binding protein [Povalibacter sp.]|uniref:AAA family ATPase n=1 Tax=Povalibacter sp. TaxID=1962978 RepID=UPI002CB947D6|nr:ATP-binding protein [Povalibacter sp.]HMN42936.1 ATP-binding protein [Povalibacter sp.]